MKMFVQYFFATQYFKAQWVTLNIRGLFLDNIFAHSCGFIFCSFIKINSWCVFHCVALLFIIVHFSYSGIVNTVETFVEIMCIFSKCIYNIYVYIL